MAWINLGNPRPWPEPRPYKPVAWPELDAIPLVPADDALTPPIAYSDLVSRRRTRRSFARLDLKMLGAFTWLSCRSQLSGTQLGGIPLSLRPALSAGAIHPIHLLVVDPAREGWFRYDPAAHALRQISTRIESCQALSAMQAILVAPDATLLLFAAEPERTAAKYENADSLVWRDAGVLLGLMAMAAEALSLSFCPLGVTGEPWISRLLDQPGLAGVGAAFVGSTP